jgi:DNA-directed RNA polymerase subunit RPC12/RpoP
VSTLYRRYLVDVRPLHRETLPSYSARLLAANFETEQHQQLLTRQMNASQRVADREAAWLAVLAAKTKRNRFHFEADAHGQVTHPDGTACQTCTSGLTERVMCTLCAHGATVSQHPHFDDLVCVHHRRWIGLGANAAEQRPAATEVIRAARQFAKLRRQHRIDVRLFTMLSDAVNESLPGSGQQGASVSAGTFPLVVALATEITSVSFAQHFFDPASAFERSHRYLTEAVERILGHDDTEITRAIWLYARPTVWAIRDSLITGAPYVSAWAHDLRVPDTVGARFAGTPPPTEPFSNYLAVTGDDQLSAARHGLKPMRDGAVRAIKKVPGSGRRALTICAAGHQFESPTPIPTSLAEGRAPTCPLCRHRIIVPGYNDIATTHPEVAAEFDPVLNGELTAEQVAPSSLHKYFWRCPTGHSYQATAGSRTSSKTTCPLCLGRIIAAGVNDLSTTHPHLIADWHPGSLSHTSPTAVTAGSNEHVVWLCPNGHTYEMRIWDRVHGKGCRACSQAATRASAANLSVTHPALASEWHPTFNGEALASGYTAGSGAKVYWLCPFNHHYQQRIERRVAGYKCSVCSRRTLVPNVNDLATTEPVLVLEWHPYLNTKTPSKIFPGTDKHWWKCLANKHKYQQSVPHRIKSRGCPDCPAEERLLSNR